ncbi:MAG: methyl-accepting chemotaxis protein [Chloroflexota bacterium]|nr:methyl-accepting chemotaxis protein [Chloroflexota bacterium]
MEYLIIAGIMCGVSIAVLGGMYGFFRWTFITKSAALLLPMICLVVVLGFWIGSVGISVATVVSSIVICLGAMIGLCFAAHRIIVEPFSLEQCLQVEGRREHMGRQVGGVSDVMESVANSGDLMQNVVVGWDDEIGRLAGSTNAMIGSLRETAGLAEMIASGDLSVMVEPKSENDVLGNAFAKMVGNYKSVISEVSENVSQLSTASHWLAKAANQAGDAMQGMASTTQEMARSACDQSQCAQETAMVVERLSDLIAQISIGAERQSDSVAKVSSSMGEVSDMMGRLSRDAATAEWDSKKVIESVDNGAILSASAIDGMEKVKGAVGLASESIYELERRSVEIDRLVTTIDDVAARTNLLALNVMVKAGRANARRKAADEVSEDARELADCMAKVAKEVADLAIDLQDNVQDIALKMEDGDKEVEEGYELLGELNVVLEDIRQSSNGISEKMGWIIEEADQVNCDVVDMVDVVDSMSVVVQQDAVAIRKLSSGVSQVAQAIDVVTSVVEENTAAMEQISATADEMNAEIQDIIASSDSLERMADRSRELMSSFNLVAHMGEGWSDWYRGTCIGADASATKLGVGLEGSVGTAQSNTVQTDIPEVTLDTHNMNNDIDSKRPGRKDSIFWSTRAQ